MTRPFDEWSFNDVQKVKDEMKKDADGAEGHLSRTRRRFELNAIEMELTRINDELASANPNHPEGLKFFNERVGERRALEQMRRAKLGFGDLIERMLISKAPAPRGGDR